MSFLPLSHPQRSQQQPPSSPLLPSEPPDESAADSQPPPTDSTPLIPPPHFTPFFTLLSFPTSPTTHHPSVHYIFSTDTPDSDPITAAALQVLDPASSATSSPADVTNRNENSHGEEDGRIKERYVLLDMDATGTKVLSAQSMSPDWAVTSTEVGPAPTWDDRGGGEGMQEGEEGRGLMLRIEGMEVQERSGLEEGREGEEMRLEELVQVYERRMGELRRVVDAGVGVGGEVWERE